MSLNRNIQMRRNNKEDSDMRMNSILECVENTINQFALIEILLSILQ